MKGSLNHRAFVLKNLCDPGFPLYFVLRNLGWLKSETWWTRLSQRSRRAHAIRIVQERIAIFHEVKEWKRRQNTKAPAPEDNGRGKKPPQYCDKCGLCCEVASGMPDFPSPGELPAQWEGLFGDGLGQGHRFCPFLWEDNGTGGSLCSIYQFRSNPCRLFGSEECDFFWKSPEPDDVSSERKLLLMGRWLAKLINARKLPLASSYVTAKRPKLLEFNRI
ncbi:MAG: YkgJ family cysteine cluster protein [Syntrophobacteraceae bacterium]